MKSYILLDRSGSMAFNWVETINALNAYAEGLDPTDKIYVAAFDSASEMRYTVLRDSKVVNFTPISADEIKPDGMTPLIQAANTILDKAFEDDKKKAVLVFITDGAENSSKEVTMRIVKDKLKLAEERKWEVLFIGSNFSGIGAQAASFGVDATKFINITTNNAVAEMSTLATRTASYGSTGARVEFTDEDRKRASS